jgi:hypothetical protein
LVTYQNYTKMHGQKNIKISPILQQYRSQQAQHA